MNKFDCDFLNRKTDKDLKTLFATWKDDLDSITSQLDIIYTRMTNCKTVGIRRAYFGGSHKLL